MIELVDLGVSLSGTPILRGYSMSVAKGSVLAVMGANGVGKTTLLNTIMGLRKPSEGTVRVAGRLGFVPQIFQAAFSYSVIDMVLMGRARRIGLFGSPSVADYRVARDYLKRMGVEKLEQRTFNTLSGGQRQLVIIAQALCSECDILVLDEPCSSLDYKNQSIVMQSSETPQRRDGHDHRLFHARAATRARRGERRALDEGGRQLPARTHRRGPDISQSHPALRRSRRPRRVCRRQRLHLRAAVCRGIVSKRIAFLTWGNGSQIRSFHDFGHYLDDMLYLRDLHRHDLSRYAAIVVPDAMDSEAVRVHARALNDYVRQGGFLVVFGGRDTAEWIDVVDLEWRPIHARDWLWWTKPGGRLEIHQPEPRHQICDTIPLRDMGWHWSGVFALNEQAISALNLDDDSASLFLDFDRLPGGGRLIVSTLDPHVHNGERFMPATTRFLKSFYPWLNRELGIEREKLGFTLTYLQCLHHPTEWEPDTLAPSLAAVGGGTSFLPLYELCESALVGTDILYIPNNQDQFFLREQQGVLLAFLASGGHLIINSEPADTLAAASSVPSRRCRRDRSPTPRCA